MAGLLIGIEGIDGSGKSTFAQALWQALSDQKLAVLLTREPGGTKFGLKLRQILQYREEIGTLDYKAEFLLFAADRAQHFTQVVLPALQAGQVVLSDRTADSSLVYQGYGRGLELAMLQQINDWARAGNKPRLTFYLEIDYETALTRIGARAEKLTAFELAGPEFIAKIIAGFDQLYQDRSDVIRLDGRLATSALVAQALRIIGDLKC